MDDMYVQDPILTVILNRLDTIDTRMQKVEDTLIRMARIKEAQKGDEFLDNQDLCTLLKGTIQKTIYRTERFFSYILDPAIPAESHYPSISISAHFFERAVLIPEAGDSWEQNIALLFPDPI